MHEAASEEHAHGWDSIHDVQGLVVKEVPFRNGPKNSPFRENSPFHISPSINGKGLFSQTDQRSKRNFFYNKPQIRLARIHVAEGGAEEGEAVEGDDPVGRVHHRVVQQVAARLHVAIPATERGRVSLFSDTLNLFYKRQREILPRPIS